jgi:hypothetical protein
MIFAISFLGALFAIFASLLIVYSYVALRLIPQLKKSLRAFIAEMGPRALFERSGVDPAQMMRDLGIDVIHPSRRPTASSLVAPPAPNALRMVFTCEDHGRCPGCPKVLAQFEAIVQHQGAESFDDVERRCYAQLREQLLADEQLDGESESDRQHRLAARVVETLVREGYSLGIARGVAWGCSKEERATYAGWLSIAREGCQKMSIVLKENAV